MIDYGRLHIVKTKYNNAGQLGFAGGHKIAEIQVMRQQDTSLITGLLQNFRIWHSMKTLFTQMNRVMPNTGEKSDSVRRNAHIRKKPHADAGSSRYTLSSASHAAYFRL